MPAFTETGDLRRYVGAVFEHALADDDLGPKLSGLGIALRMVTTDPADQLTVDLTNKIVGAEDTAPNTTMHLSSETANGFWQGKVNIQAALARRKIKVDGKLAPLMGLLPAARQLFPIYVDLLRSDGRTDLIID
jgi:putative sterol carrier protein